jgi:hypothetical protein
VADVQSARAVAHQAAWVAIITAGLIAIFAILFMFGVPMVRGIDGWALIDAAFWGALASGIWRMSRVASAVGLAATVAERVLLPDREMGMAYLIATVILVLAFINALRATSAYHRLQKPAPKALAPEPLEPR